MSGSDTELRLLAGRKSRLEVRGIAMNIRASGTGLVPAVHNDLWRTYKKLDWAAFNRLLDVAR